MSSIELPDALKLGDPVMVVRKGPEDVQYSDCFFCFLDILGYKSIMSKQGENAAFFLRNILMDVFEFGSGLYASLRFKFLSDSILIWTANDEPVQFWNLVNAVDMVRHQLFKNHILTRGGISHGPNYVDDDIIVSPALVEAYGLEQIANYPRVIVSEKAFAKGISTIVEEHGRYFVVLEKKIIRKIDPERILVCVDGRKILSPLYISVAIFYLKHGVYIDSSPGDAELSEIQKAGLKSSGEADLREYCKILKAIQLNGRGDSKAQDKIAYLIVDFNYLARQTKMDILVIDPVRLD